MASAVTAQQTGKVPCWLYRAFFNRVAHVDLSRDAWTVTVPVAAGRKFLPVTDADLAALRWFSRLRALDLHGSQVSDAGLVHLKRLKYLEQLNLADTQVTEAGLNELRSALPKCAIQR